VRKFLVTAVTISRGTRRRVGKSWVELVEVPDETRPLDVERQFETAHSKQKTAIAKVIDVREVLYESEVD
jgi:hypothetical protein